MSEESKICNCCGGHTDNYTHICDSCGDRMDRERDERYKQYCREREAEERRYRERLKNAGYND